MTLARIEEAMMPKNMHWETGAAVKPEASMIIALPYKVSERIVHLTVVQDQ